MTTGFNKYEFEHVFTKLIECLDPKYHDFIHQAKGRYLLIDKRKKNEICKLKATLDEILKQTEEIKNAYNRFYLSVEYKELLEKQYSEKIKMLFDSLIDTLI